MAVIWLLQTVALLSDTHVHAHQGLRFPWHTALIEGQKASPFRGGRKRKVFQTNGPLLNGPAARMTFDSSFEACRR